LPLPSRVAAEVPVIEVAPEKVARNVEAGLPVVVTLPEPQAPQAAAEDEDATGQFPFAAVPLIVTPPHAVALFVPEPLTVRLEPVPRIIAAVVFVPLEMLLKAAAGAKHPVAFPFARIPIAAFPAPQFVGNDARAVAVAAFPVVLWLSVGIIGAVIPVMFPPAVIAIIPDEPTVSVCGAVNVKSASPPNEPAALY
jgi:hypothetical protein